MDIVDGQAHLDVTQVETAIAAMDAIGIQTVLIDEYAGLDELGHPIPNQPLPSGGYRPICPGAEAASRRFPDRLAYLLRILPNDPGFEAQVELVKRSPHAKAARITLRGPDDGRALEDGGYDALFGALIAHDVPVFITVHEHGRRLFRSLAKFPELRITIDHCGVPIRAWPETEGPFETALEMARYPNVALKWSRAPSRLSRQAYPFADLTPHLERALEAFGPQRLMWASDHTEERGHHTWAEALFCLRDSPALSDADKEWVLGRTIRTRLDWPRASAG